MSDRFDLIEATLSAVLGLGSTLTIPYPAHRSADDYLGGGAHELHSLSYRSLFAANGDFAVTFGASNLTVTITTGIALVAGTKIYLHLDRAEKNASMGEVIHVANESKMTLLTPVRINLGAPITADADGVCASQALNTGADGLINGALAALGVATFDVPRNVVAAWTGTAVLTVTGQDEYGQTIVESSASGTSLTGKKAFKTITRVRVSANVTGLTVGSGVILGLPMFLPDVVDVTREILNGAAATAGTVVAGDQTAATATTGDVRGTYNPNSAPNGTNVYELNVALRDPSYKGQAQFAG